jgi:hypothetical protein
MQTSSSLRPIICCVFSGLKAFAPSLTLPGSFILFDCLFDADEIESVFLANRLVTST